LATTISAPTRPSVIAGMRLRAGRTGSGKVGGRMVAQAIATARAVGATGNIVVRGDSAFGSRAVVRACLRGKAQFSLVMVKHKAIQRAIDSIAESAWTPVRYPSAVRDPDTGGWISDAEVAELPYTAVAATTDRITARLVVRRVRDARPTPATRRPLPDARYPTRCSRSGGITRSSRTRTCRPLRPTSSTAATPSSVSVIAVLLDGEPPGSAPVTRRDSARVCRSNGTSLVKSILISGGRVLVEGLGCDSSEGPVLGVEPAALDSVAAPVVLLGPSQSGSGQTSSFLVGSINVTGHAGISVKPKLSVTCDLPASARGHANHLDK
jgi:hypothetical protein